MRRLALLVVGITLWLSAYSARAEVAADPTPTMAVADPVIEEPLRPLFPTGDLAGSRGACGTGVASMMPVAMAGTVLLRPAVRRRRSR